ncbi:MAG: acetylglutamate kinase [Firmicutes bacterium]|nr:acetylglutamate kinase [Bacillota bacterium]
MDPVIQKAEVLTEALPYMRTFVGKTFVVKYGGAAMVDPELKKAICKDLVLLKYIGINPVIVHGGGPEISQMMKRMGKEPRFVNGLRVTDEETMEIVEMVLAGKVNKEIVTMLNQNGGKAVGLTGKDANLIVARKRPAEISIDRNTGDELKVDLGYVGDIDRVDTALLSHLSSDGYIPVLTSIGVGLDGESYNINADYVASEVAQALKAEKLIMLTDVEGILENPECESSIISSLSAARAREMIAAGHISGGMIPKVEACIRAIEGGVARAHIIDGRLLHSILLEIFTDRGIGTMVTR